MKLIFNRAAILVMMFFLFGASNGCRKVSAAHDLYAYINEVQRQPVVSIKPLPKFLLVSFKHPQLTNYKEKYSVHTFRFMGAILNNKKYWSLVLLPNHQIIKVQKGDLVGKEQAKVVRITAVKIELRGKNEKNNIININY